MGSELQLQKELKKETKKWLERIEKEIRRIRILDKGKKDLVENIKAYVKDCKYFSEKGDLVRAFEAVVWAWAWLNILRELKIVR